MICLKYIMTVENEAINNKIKYYSLLYDGFEYIYLEEWENSIFVKFQRNDNIILENFSFKEMDTNRYLINYNKSNIQLIKLYKSKIKLANTDIPNIEILKSINKFCDKNPKFEGKKLISFFGIITAINETSLYNKRCLNITISDMKDPKFSISFIFWKLNKGLKLKMIYQFNNIIIKTEDSNFLLSTSMYDFLNFLNFFI